MAKKWGVCEPDLTQCVRIQKGQIMRELQSAIYDGIKRGIQVSLENQCYGSAVTLIYSGIDAMACLGMPATQEDATRRDFVSWCERYIRISGRETVTGLEWYAARCAVVHRFGVRSRLSREAKVRLIGYMDRADPPVRVNPEVSKEVILVSIHALAEAFFAAIDRFVIDLFADPSRREVAEKRLRELLVMFPASEAGIK